MRANARIIVPVGESWASDARARKVMQGNRSRDTKPEMAVRRLLHARGLRYRVNFRPLPDLRRTADLVFTKARIAVFIDGCFWHGCSVHHRASKSNIGYWHVKIENNIQRDRETTEVLVAAGWTVMRFWSHDDPSSVATQIQRAFSAKNSPSIETTGSTDAGQGDGPPTDRGSG